MSNKRIRNMIVYTIIVVVITSLINIGIISIINNKQIEKINTEIETVETTQGLEYITTMCNFEKEEIVCD